MRTLTILPILRPSLGAWILLFMLSLCAVLAGCSRDGVFAMIASPEEQAQARAYIDHLRARNYDAIERGLREDLRTPDLRKNLETMAALVPAGEPRSVRIVGAHKNLNGGVTQLNLSFELEFATGWLLATVVTEQKNGGRSVIGFNVFPRAQSLEDEHRFGLSGKQAVHYLVLAAAIAAFAATVFALYRCVRTRNLWRKPLWILFILVGFGQLTLDWTSGAWRFIPLSLQLFSAGMTSVLNGPWMISVSLPVGALVFLLRSRNGTLTLKPGIAKQATGLTADPDEAGDAARPEPQR